MNMERTHYAALLSPEAIEAGAKLVSPERYSVTSFKTARAEDTDHYVYLGAATIVAGPFATWDRADDEIKRIVARAVIEAAIAKARKHDAG
jgi:hypothetical protein